MYVIAYSSLRQLRILTRKSYLQKKASGCHAFKVELTKTID